MIYRRSLDHVMDYGYMSMERVTRLVARLGHPMVYQGPDMAEPVVLLPLADYEALVGVEEQVSAAQPSLPFDAKPVTQSQEVEKNAYLSENRRLLEALAQFSAGQEEFEGGIPEPRTVPLPVIEDAQILEQVESEPVDGLGIEEQFYLETTQNG